MLSVLVTNRKESNMSEFTERHAELITLVKLSKLARELELQVHNSMLEALENATPEAVDEILLQIRELELIKSDLREQVNK
jgi:hypothetical protein